MKTLIMDCEWKVPEGGDVIRDAEKVWCVVFKELGSDSSYQFTEANFSDLKPFLSKHLDSGLTLVCHNMIGADLHIFRRFFGIDFTIFPDSLMGKPCTFVDTWSWSMRLNPDRPPVQGSKSIHGLEAWGIRTGTAKPQVHDWSDQPIEVYLNRCQKDVIINEGTYLDLLKERGLRV